MIGCDQLDFFRSGSVQSVSTAGVSEMTIASGQSGNNEWQCAGNADTQTPSCRALAGSMASFEHGNGGTDHGNSSGQWQCQPGNSDHHHDHNNLTTEGVPLLLPEESELETNSNSVIH